MAGSGRELQSHYGGFARLNGDVPDPCRPSSARVCPQIVLAARVTAENEVAVKIAFRKVRMGAFRGLDGHACTRYRRAVRGNNGSRDASQARSSACRKRDCKQGADEKKTASAG